MSSVSSFRFQLHVLDTTMQILMPKRRSRDVAMAERSSASQIRGESFSFVIRYISYDNFAALADQLPHCCLSNACAHTWALLMVWFAIARGWGLSGSRRNQ